jgi:hypothetical protein
MARFARFRCSILLLRKDKNGRLSKPIGDNPQSLDRQTGDKQRKNYHTYQR